MSLNALIPPPPGKRRRSPLPLIPRTPVCVSKIFGTLLFFAILEGASVWAYQERDASISGIKPIQKV